jgi:hypothetical protein
MPHLWYKTPDFSDLLMTGSEGGLLAQSNEFLNSIQNSFNSGFDRYLIGFFLVMAGIIVAVVCVKLAMWLNRTYWRQAQIAGQPDSFFKTLLNQLDLDDGERKLLAAMAAGSRLRHPAMMLLSPNLLNWTRQVWQDESGPNVVNRQVVSRIDDIRQKLFDTPARPQSPI